VRVDFSGLTKLSDYDFESGASASSATPAALGSLSRRWGGLKGGGAKSGLTERLYRRDAEGAEKDSRAVSGVGFGLCLEFGGFDDGAEDAAGADDVFAGAGDRFEDEEAAFVSGEARVSADVGADGGCFQVVDFDPGADGDGSGRYVVAHSLRGGHFHHSDHGGSGEDGG
jgi:hypothetical protein